MSELNDTPSSSPPSRMSAVSRSLSLRFSKWKPAFISELRWGSIPWCRRSSFPTRQHVYFVWTRGHTTAPKKWLSVAHPHSWECLGIIDDVPGVPHGNSQKYPKVKNTKEDAKHVKHSKTADAACLICFILHGARDPPPPKIIVIGFGPAKKGFHQQNMHHPSLESIWDNWGCALWIQPNIKNTKEWQMWWYSTCFTRQEIRRQAISRGCVLVWFQHGINTYCWGTRKFGDTNSHYIIWSNTI